MYIGTLIDEIIRPKTGNTTFVKSTTTGETLEGISDTIILSDINDALAFLQSRIISVYANEFISEDIQNTVVDQEAYTIDDNVFLNRRLTVDFSPNGALDGYFPLPPATLQQRDTSSGDVYQYIRRNKQILLNRIPDRSDSKVRINYYRSIDKLDIRRGQITSKTATTVVLDNDDWLDNLSLSGATYICIVSSTGAVKDYNVVVTSYDSGSRTITIPSQTLVGIAGDYVVVGKYTTTHLSEEHPERMLDFAKVMAQARIFNQDSSMDEIAKTKEAADILTDILDSYSQTTDDIQDIPIVDEGLV